MDDALNGVHEIAGIVEPAVGVVDDSAPPVGLDAVVVDEPFEWRPAVNDVLVGLGEIGDAHAFADDHGRQLGWSRGVRRSQRHPLGRG